MNKPGQSVGFIASVLSCDTMRLSWQQPSFDPRGGSLRYHLQLSSRPKKLLHSFIISNESYVFVLRIFLNN